MDYDEEIMKAFREAEKKGRKRISSEALILLTDIPEHVIHRKLEILRRYGKIKQLKPQKKSKYWELLG